MTTCLEEIERKYGTGQDDGVSPKKYHNRIHTEHVIADTLAIAGLAIESGRILPRQQELLHIASAFHDIEQETKSYGNEMASSDIMEEMASPTDLFNLDEMLEIREIILGTEIIFVKGVPTQLYAQGELAQILADADLAALGQPIDVYKENSENLYDELSNEPESKELSIKTLETSELLLQNHRYFTPEAERLFPNQEANLLFVRSELEKLRSIR